MNDAKVGIDSHNMVDNFVGLRADDPYAFSFGNAS